jgi:hypothetical protein
MEKSMQSFGKFLASTTVSMLASGGAIAQTSYYEYGPPPPNPPPGWIAQGRSVQEWDRFRYGYSGTCGRMGLGADPAHPEGVIFLRRDGSVVACPNRYFDEF